MAEQTYLDEGEVSVTNARFIVSGQTYTMSGVTSVKAIRQAPSRKWPIIIILIGLIGVVAGGESRIYALAWLGIGVVWWIRQKSKYTVLLNSASGEEEALTSKDGGFIGRIVGALNEAIVARG